MRLKHFVITILLIYVFVVCGGFLLYRINIVYPQIVTQILLHHQLDLRAIQKSFSVEENNLMLLLYDWSKWDDLYEYMENSNEDFVKSNLVDSILSDMNLNGIFFFNDKNQLNTGIEEEKNGIRTYDFSSLEFGLQDVFAEFRWPSNIDVNCKFQYADKVDQLALLCVSTIQDSNEEKPKNGYLAFSRTIDIEEIKAVTGANFKVSTIPENMTNLISIRKMLNLNKLSSRYVMGVANESQGTMDFSIEVKYEKSSLPTLIDYQTSIMVLILLLIPMVMIFIISKFFLNPLADMSLFILSLRQGDESVVLPHSGFIVEVKVFSRALKELMVHVESERLMLEQKSMTDALTGVKNRRAFDEGVSDLWRTAPRQSKPIVLIIADIDYFKNFNDSLGHQKGDDALKAVALALKAGCRRPSDQLYRYGGEEFAITIALEKAEDVDVVMTSFQHMVASLQYPHPSSPITPFITVSMGACLIAKPGDWMKDYSYKTAVEISDKALYESKRSGRNNYTLHVLTVDGADLVDKNTDLSCASISDLTSSKNSDFNDNKDIKK